MTPRKMLILLLPLLAAGLLLTGTPNQAQAPVLPPIPGEPDQADLNHKERYDRLNVELQNGSLGEREAAKAIGEAIGCLNQLNRIGEADALLDGVLTAYPNAPRVKWRVAYELQNLPHYGTLVAGEFTRGSPRGRGKIVNCLARDRVRALRLMHQAAAKQEGAALRDLPTAILGHRYQTSAWELQLLTNLDELPDYEDGWSRGGGSDGAPVDAAGDPVLYDLPESWQAAKNDGERLRWAWEQLAKHDDYHRAQVLLDRAAFLQSQFGVSTLAQYLPHLPSPSAAGDNTPSILALHTLADGETIARLANGVRRFELPDEHNHVKLLQRVLALQGDRSQIPIERAASTLARVFENRRQYPRADQAWATAQEHASREQRERIADARRQITGAWGELQPVGVQPAGQGASVEYRFRNGKSVNFTARRIDLQRLLTDVKAYLDSRPGKLDWQQLELNNLGHRLLQGDQKKYLGEVAAEWTLELEPAADHFDKQLTVSTPVQQGGAYWLTAQMADGNTCHTVLWLADVAIVRKSQDGKQLYYVADARRGGPLAGAQVELFAYRTRPVRDRPNRYQVDTLRLAEQTDADGFVTLPNRPEGDDGYQWLAIATDADGRTGYLGIEGLGRPRYQRQDYDATKAFIVTDRPVYRPGQTVHYKAWVQRAAYGRQETDSEFAHKSFRVEVTDGRNERVQQHTLTANAYGAVEGELTLPAGATLGAYRIEVLGHGAQSFRVEEYKKPEYEVTVDAPADGVALGQEFTAKINARYYFGAPVVNATVKYKVTRTSQTVEWYPPRPWDWLYGPGYGWLGCQADWLPGFARWGLRCPGPSWQPWRRPQPPEVVAQGTAPIGPDGTLEVRIDTALAKALHGDSDHRYQVEAQVTDESRRTIVGVGRVLAARQPFRAYVWTGRGHYRVGDQLEARVAVRSAAGQPLAKPGELRLLKLAYAADGQPPEETEVRRWELATTDDGQANLQIKASEPGQYRLSFIAKTDAGEQIEGGHVFTIAGEGFDGGDFTFDDLEITPDKAEYQPGEKVRLQVSTARTGSTVLLFARPAGGVYPAPRVIRLKGKSTFVELDVAPTDMPNLIVEAMTIGDAQVFQAVRDIAVPPVSKALELEVLTDASEYQPGQQATVKLRLTDAQGQPVAGDAALTIYDKSVEYISGGSNVGDIRKHFWDWRRRHYPSRSDNLARASYNLTPPGQHGMRPLGAFGGVLDDRGRRPFDSRGRRFSRSDRTLMLSAEMAPMAAASVPQSLLPQSQMNQSRMSQSGEAADLFAVMSDGREQSPQPPMAEPTVRTEFADTALWRGVLETNSDGVAEVSLDMPQNLTAWVVRAWGLGHGARVGQGAAEVVTSKDLLVRLQTPRFLVETDEVILSANVHNYLDAAKQVTVRLELDGGALESPSNLTQQIEVPANGDHRVDWRVSAMREGEATVRAVALTDQESDAMELRVPVRVHGILKQEAYSGVIAADGERGAFEVEVPAKRRVEQSRLEVRYSPTLAGAMVDALPYLIDYPHGCTEQTLNRFLPAVLTQRTLIDLGVDLAQVREKQTNLNPQQLGEPADRQAQWKRFDRNPVFDQAELEAVVKAGVRRLTDMQLSDGGWGWFSGYGEHSSAHTTAVVFRGLQLAKKNDAAILPDVLSRGEQWLRSHQQEQLARLRNVDRDGQPIDKSRPHKRHADNLDALVYLTLVEAGYADGPMHDFLHRDRATLAPYALAMFGLALHQQGGHAQERDALIRALKQYVQTDNENQTAWLNLPGGYWWRWYGSEYEAHAYFLKLLAATEPDSDLAAGLVKHLLNNRSHATRWNSTRDTALVVEAMADYLRGSGEAQPDQTIEVWIDGEKRKTVAVTAENLFSFDNTLVIEGAALESGRHTVELRKQGGGRLYYNGYLTNFTLQENIRAAGLEVRVERQLYKLTRADAQTQVAGDRGQAIGQRAEKYDRQRITNLASVQSGDLIEVELTLESKNDYEYLLITDPKPAGFEPVEVQSGYNGNEIGAYVEYRDQSVNLFARTLARGRRSVSYRLRAETPGQFSALPTQIEAMYAPELKGNSDEIKVKVSERAAQEESESHPGGTP